MALKPQLDKIERAILDLAALTGHRVDLDDPNVSDDPATARRIRNNPLGDEDGDGIPNFMDTHPDDRLNVAHSNKVAYFNGTGPSGQLPAGDNPAALTNQLTTLLMLQLLQSMQTNLSGAGMSVGGVDGTIAQQQLYSELMNDYRVLYGIYEDMDFTDTAGNAVDGHAEIDKLNIRKPSMYPGLRTNSDHSALLYDYRALWDSYNNNVGVPPRFAQKR